jgi:hypothetical protein
MDYKNKKAEHNEIIKEIKEGNGNLVEEMKEIHQTSNDFVKLEIQQQSQEARKEGIEIAKVIQKEISINREVIRKENNETKALLMLEREEENWRYNDLHEGLELLLKKSNELNPQIKEQTKNNRSILEMNAQLQDRRER